MIRWSYLLPRLVLLGALLVVAHVAIPVVVRWSLTHGWRAATGTVMGVDSVRLSVVRGRLRLDGAEFARSRASRTNFLEFDSAELSLDLGELARRRCVVNSAHLHGIRLDTP